MTFYRLNDGDVRLYVWDILVYVCSFCVVCVHFILIFDLVKLNLLCVVLLKLGSVTTSFSIDK
jgi:hypothetical protein